MSNQNQFEEDNSKEQKSIAFLRQGLSYLINGANQCLEQMKEIKQSSGEENKQELRYLKNELSDKIRVFCLAHLKGVSGSNSQETRADSVNQGQSHNLEKRNNRRLRSANLRLKKTIRKLKISLYQAKHGISLLLEIKENRRNKESSSKPESLNEGQSSNVTQLNQDMNVHQNSANSQQNKEEVSRGLGFKNEGPFPTAKKFKEKGIQIEGLIPKVEETQSKNKDLKHLTSKVDLLHNSYLKLCEKQIQEMRIYVEEVGNHRQEWVIGGHWTFVAMKDHSSYMIATAEKGYQVFEKNTLVKSAIFPSDKRWLGDLIYVKKLDCYLLYLSGFIYRKDINNSSLSVFMEVKCGTRAGTCLKYSNLHEKVIIAKDLTSLSSINIRRKTIEIEVTKSIGGNIRDFRFIGEYQDRLVSISCDGYLLLYKFNFRMNEGSVTNHFQIKLKEGRDEAASGLAVCSNGKFIFVQISQNKSPYASSRIAVLENKEQNLSIRTILDRRALERGTMMSFDTFGYMGRHIIVIGLSKMKGGDVEVFDYDTATGQFRELRYAKACHKELNPPKFGRLANEFYYSGNYGQVMKLSIQI